ncbi:MAG: secondary thiamine-phosphate synthase enzyme YjbQ [Methanomassiliicoccales archaeon]
MAVFRKILHLRTQHEGDIKDITGEIKNAVQASGLKEGLACAFVMHSTAAIFTMEHEPGLEKDMKDALQRILPKEIDYEHHKTWNDRNGHSHLRASFLGPSVTLPFQEGKLDLGTWQQVVLMELDTNGRERKVVIQIVGE